MDSKDSQSPNKTKVSGTSSFFCRICHDEGDLGSFCNCTGTVGLVHLACLEKWLSTIGSQSCELCHYEFQIDCKTKSIREVYIFLTLIFGYFSIELFFSRILYSGFKHSKKTEKKDAT